MDTSSAIEAELARVLESRCFRSRKTAQKFLRHVVLKTTEGDSETINQHSIAVEALNKGKDFDPSSNPLIRVQAGRLRKQLEEYYAEEGRENLLRIVLPTGSYQPLFIDQEEHTQRNVHAGRRLSSISQGPTLVCMPRLFTHEQEAGWETITRLTRDYVIKLTHFNFCQILFADEAKSQQQTWPEAAWDAYQADFALLFDLYDDEGGYNLKCSLVHSETKQIVWAESYELGQEYPEPAQQTHIFKHIAHHTIGLEQGIAHDFWARHIFETQHPLPPQHQVMLALRQAIWDLNPTTLHEARNVCELRLKQFPRDIQTIIVYTTLCLTGFFIEDDGFDAMRDDWVGLARRLLHLAPGNAHAYLFSAFTSLLNDQLDEVEQHLQQALTINPLDTQLSAIVGVIYIGRGDWDEGIRLIQDSMGTSPTHPDWYNIPLALNHYRTGDYLNAMKSANRVNANTLWGPVLRTVLYRHNKLAQKAERELSQLNTTYPDSAAIKPAYFDHLAQPVAEVIDQLWSELKAT